MSYFVDAQYVGKHLAKFLNEAKAAGFGFSATTSSADRHPRERIEDVSNIMTWESDASGVVSFSKAGVRQFSYGDNDPKFVKMVSTTVCPVNFVVAFYIAPNGNLHIQHAHLVDVWKQLSKESQ